MKTGGVAKIEYCDNCGKEMVIKRGRFGVFLACKGYPDCKTTRRLVEGTRIAREPDEPLDEKCPDSARRSAPRRAATANSSAARRYPKCKFTRPIARHPMPEMRRGELVAAVARGRPAALLRLQPLSRCDFTTPHEPIRAVSEVRRGFHRGEENQDGHLPHVHRKAATGKLKRLQRLMPQPRRPQQRRQSQRPRRPPPISFTHKNPQQSAPATNPK